MADSNFEQTILFDKIDEGISSIKVEFTKASDLFGRVIMYKFDVLSLL